MAYDHYYGNYDATLTKDVYSAGLAQNAIQIEPTSIKKRLLQERDSLQQRINNLDIALDFLEKNPQFEAFQDILRKVL